MERKVDDKDVITEKEEEKVIKNGKIEIREVHRYRKAPRKYRHPKMKGELSYIYNF